MQNTPRLIGEPPIDSKELDRTLDAMRVASRNFYAAAANTNCHAFLEFTGLINEFITACMMAANQGRDFRYASVHGDNQIALMDHQVAYIREKLDCIYGMSTLEKGKHRGG